MSARLLLLAVLLFPFACGRPSPEAQVKAAFEACRAAVEAGDVDRAVAPLAPEFQGPEGMDRAGARLFLLATLRRQRAGITVLRNDVRIDGEDAFQQVDLVLTGRGGALWPEDASRRTYLLHWRRTHGAWKLVELQSPEGP